MRDFDELEAFEAEPVLDRGFELGMVPAGVLVLRLKCSVFGRGAGAAGVGWLFFLAVCRSKLVLYRSGEVAVGQRVVVCVCVWGVWVECKGRRGVYTSDRRGEGGRGNGL